MKSIAKKLLTLFAILALSLNCAIFTTGCKEKGPAEEAGEDIDEALEDAADEMDDAADKAADEADDAADRTRDALD